MVRIAYQQLTEQVAAKSHRPAMDAKSSIVTQISAMHTTSISFPHQPIGASTPTPQTTATMPNTFLTRIITTFAPTFNHLQVIVSKHYCNLGSKLPFFANSSINSVLHCLVRNAQVLFHLQHALLLKSQVPCHVSGQTHWLHAWKQIAFHTQTRLVVHRIQFATGMLIH